MMRIIFFILCLLPPVAVIAEAPAAGKVEAILKAAEAYEEKIKPPALDKNSRAAKAAEAFYLKTFLSEEYQQQIESHKQHIQDTRISGQAGKRDKTPESTVNGKIFLFISSSIPIQTLRNYARDMDRMKNPDIIMVLRGFVDGMQLFGPTLEFLADVLVKDEGCSIMGREKCDMFQAEVQIDPFKFREFDVTAVPAIGFQSEAGEKAVVYGDVRLEYAVTELTGRLKSGQGRGR